MDERDPTATDDPSHDPHDDATTDQPALTDADEPDRDAQTDEPDHDTHTDKPNRDDTTDDPTDDATTYQPALTDERHGGERDGGDATGDATVGQDTHAHMGEPDRVRYGPDGRCRPHGNPWRCPRCLADVSDFPVFNNT